MLLSGAGLIGLVVFNLWNAVEMNASRTVLQARTQADFTAAALRGALQDPRFLRETAFSRRFEVRAGSLVVPAAVAWLVPPKYPRSADLDLLVQEKLEEVDRPGTTAPVQREVLQTLLRMTTSPREHHQWLQAHAAWYAHRQGEVAWRDALLRELDAVHGGATPVSVLLLHFAARRRLPAWAGTVIASLPEPSARPLLRRLAEQGLEVAELTAGLERTLEHRRVLVAVQPLAASLVPSLAAGRSPLVRAAGSDLLLFYPGPMSGDPDSSAGGSHSGAGALLGPADREAAFSRLASADWTALPSGFGAGITDGREAGAVTVVPGLFGVRPRTAAAPGLAGPWVFGLLIVAFASISVAGFWVFYRTMRRETEAARVRAEFLTMVTHELKTPLAGIRLLAEMLQDGHVQGRAQHEDYYRRLNNESVRLTMLIENVLDLGRMERGERAYDFKPVDLDELVDEAVELFRPIAAAAGMSITRRPRACAGAPAIRGDRNALLQSLLNVMDNARKYAAAGQRLTIEVSHDGITGAIVVRDFGPGIGRQDRARIFERFRRGAAHASGSIPGVGLGLYLSRTILRNHGGDLAAMVPDDGGPGSCFRFTLPAHADADADADATLENEDSEEADEEVMAR